jgi:hypothetical protein
MLSRFKKINLTSNSCFKMPKKGVKSKSTKSKSTKSKGVKKPEKGNKGKYLVPAIRNEAGEIQILWNKIDYWPAFLEMNRKWLNRDINGELWNGYKLDQLDAPDNFLKLLQDFSALGVVTADSQPGNCTDWFQISKTHPEYKQKKNVLIKEF